MTKAKFYQQKKDFTLKDAKYTYYTIQYIGYFDGMLRLGARVPQHLLPYIQKANLQELQITYKGCYTPLIVKTITYEEYGMLYVTCTE